MYATSFYLFYGFSWLIAQIPTSAIHKLSNFTFLIIYHIAKYRRSVVRLNLTNSFPEKSDKEIIDIEIKFYRHFCDLFFESFILLHASRKRALRRCRIKNLEVFEDLFSKGKSAIIATAHYGNWELLSLGGSQTKHTTLGVYKPLKNKRFEIFLNKSRERFGGIPIKMNDTLKAVIDYRQKEIPILLGLVADQTPSAKSSNYWTKFLNQDTPVFIGIERIAQKFDYPVYFCSIDKVRRGKYELNFTLITDTPKLCEPYEITDKYLSMLETLIRNKPEYWLWSHKRWKVKKKPESNTSQPSL